MNDDLLRRAADHWRNSLPTSDAPTLDDFRAASRTFADAFPIPDDVVVSSWGADGDLGIEIAPATAAHVATVLHVHGGGYVVGAPEESVALAGDLAIATRARVRSVRYPLAPEHPHPAPLEAVLSAYRSCIAELPASNVAVVAESAGAGVLLAALLEAKAAGDPLPAAVALFSPWIDLTLRGASLDDYGPSDPINNRDGLTMMAALYLGDADPTDSSLDILDRSLDGFPPMLIQVGSHEALLDDARRLAEHAMRCEVATVLEIEPGAPHVYQLFASFLPQARAALDRVGTFITTRWAT